MCVSFQIVRDEETQKFGTLNNFNVLIIDDDRWKSTLRYSKTKLCILLRSAGTDLPQLPELNYLPLFRSDYNHSCGLFHL